MYPSQKFGFWRVMVCVEYGKVNPEWPTRGVTSTDTHAPMESLEKSEQGCLDRITVCQILVYWCEQEQRLLELISHESSI